MSMGKTPQSGAAPALGRLRDWRATALGLLVAGLALGTAAAGEPAGTSTPSPEAPVVVPLDRLFELPSGFEPRPTERRSGIGEAEWRSRFAVAHERVAHSEAALRESKQELAKLAESSKSWSVAPPIGGLPKHNDAPLNYGLSQRIKKNQEEADAAKRELLDLEVEANLANVPEAWRK